MNGELGDTSVEVKEPDPISADAVDGGTSVVSKDDPYMYTKLNDFTSELFKIEIGNLPGYVGYGQLRKMLNSKLKLDCRKIKAIGYPPHYAFVTFKNEVDREKALKCLDGFSWKGKQLIAKKANPMADPMAKKRKMGDSEDCIKAKKEKTDDEVPVEIKLKNAVTPLWNVPYEEQLKKKEANIHHILVKLSKEIEKVNKSASSILESNRVCNKSQCCVMEPIRESPVKRSYRNKCEFSIGRDLDTKLRTVGFRLNSYKEGSMSVAAPDDCINISQPMLDAVKCFEAYVRKSDKEVYNPETHEGYWRQLTIRTSRNSDILLIVVMHPQQLSQDEVEAEKQQLIRYFEASSCGITSVFFQLFDKKHAGQEGSSTIIHLYGKTYLEEKVSEMTFRVSPEAFFQINVAAAEVLYSTVTDLVGISSTKTVLDICCGTGTIGLILAKQGAKVIGIEMCSEAIENAKVNAQINDVSSIEFLCGKAEDVIMTAINKCKDSDIVAVANPPRAGLHPKVLKTIRATECIKKLIYISCNPKAAFTNFVDLCRSPSNNYKGIPFYPVKALPVDMFPHTPHFELILLFERQDMIVTAINTV